MINSFKDTIYFYCDPRKGIPTGDKFQHLLICLAEGFRELGIPFFSNINYWQESPEKEEYLFNHRPDITADDCSIVVLTNNWFNIKEPLPTRLFHAQRQYKTVYLDGDDSDKTYIDKPEFRQFDFIFRNHFNKKLNYGHNFYPWSFGLSNRILQQVNAVPSFQQRKRQILINFRHWRTGHPVRNISCSSFMPQISKILQIDNSVDNPHNISEDSYHYLQWLQTGGRHYPTYYQRLQNSMACACFGGFFVPAWPQNPGNLINRSGKHLLSRLRLKTKTIVQWDSWRFWESLAAGCATFHIDFEKYGISLPVMPQNWQHYIGIDLDNVQASIDKIADDPEILKRVAIQGRIWALENYSPVPTARRFLETISQQKVTDTSQVKTVSKV
ncbi:glycosyltransferase family 1 protein [Halotia branconii]|uniref:Glycosyltransferase family 1 protein n=1 Tax=Halotia branconii CENA392 TaxID=1539056 RepID=A0AAJ6PBY5_9CYAN|nr:glycosyltransferase family 1 protein [Halotia branconii]WGV28231.1 glycosyltransferase family 1 protein [Halotia branconii CENA392]